MLKIRRITLSIAIISLLGLSSCYTGEDHSCGKNAILLIKPSDFLENCNYVKPVKFARITITTDTITFDTLTTNHDTIYLTSAVDTEFFSRRYLEQYTGGEFPECYDFVETVKFSYKDSANTLNYKFTQIPECGLLLELNGSKSFHERHYYGSSNTNLNLTFRTTDDSGIVQIRLRNQFEIKQVQ